VGTFALPAVFDRIPNGDELTISAGLLVLVVMAFVLGYFLFSALALFIATLVPSTQDAQRQMGLLSMLMFVPAWFIGLFMNQPGGTFVQILAYFPFTSPTMLMVRLGIGSVSGGEIAAALAIVAATCGRHCDTLTRAVPRRFRENASLVLRQCEPEPDRSR